MRKKGFLIATSAGFAAAAAMPSAQAADMPIKAPRYVEPAASWAGWYIGAHAGAAWQNTQTDSTDSSYGIFGLGNTSASKTGFIGGGQIGYNWQHGNFVFGLEADISGLSSKTSAHLADTYAALESKISWLSTVRSRFGLAVGDTMVYATAGVAFGSVKNSLTSNNPCCRSVTYSDSKTKVGWTVGGGVEHMLNRNWTIGLEGLFVDLGKSDLGSFRNKTTRFQNQAVIGRLKLNYKF
jgi:outer membrane immunogenic protein